MKLTNGLEGITGGRENENIYLRLGVFFPVSLNEKGKMKKSSEFRYKPQCRVLKVLDTKVNYQAVPVLYLIIGLSPCEKCPYQFKDLSTSRNFKFLYQFN